MQSGEGDAGEQRKKQQYVYVAKKQLTFFVHFFVVVLHDYNVKLPETS